MRVHLKDSDERRHYVIKKFNTIDSKIQTLYTGEFKTSDKKHAIRHSHNFFEIMFIYKGSGTIEIDKKLYKASMGDIIIYFPHNQHCEWSDKNNDINAFFFGVKNSTNLKLMFESSNIKNIVHVANEYNSFYNMFKYLVDESRQVDENFTDKIVNCIAKTLILKLLQQTHRSETNISNEIVNKIKDYIDNNYLSDISLFDLYNSLYVSEFYASRLFKQYIGITPVSYIVNKRIEDARNLLLKTDNSISSIANSVGYKDIYYFTKSFKQIVGVSPSAYREFATKNN